MRSINGILKFFGVYQKSIAIIIAISILCIVSGCSSITQVKSSENIDAQKIQASALKSEDVPVNADVENSIVQQAANAVEEVDNAVEAGQSIEEKRIEKVEEEIRYDDVSQDDDSLPMGTTKVVQNGVRGMRTITYEITDVNGVEIARTVQSDVITKKPISKITATGTKVVVKEPAASTASTNDDYYTNVDGQQIHSPSSSPVGASAQCNDGTYSYSTHRRGTCSGHGGVAEWL